MLAETEKDTEEDQWEKDKETEKGNHNKKTSNVNLYRSCGNLHGAKQMPPTPATRIQVGCTEGDGVTCHVNPDIGGRGREKLLKQGGRRGD